MKIAFISDRFSEKMGYIENCLPKAMASLGHEVHVITSNAQPYYHYPNYKEIYESFLGPPLTNCEVKKLDGYMLHRLPLDKRKRNWRIKGLLKKLAILKPQVVQTFEVNSVTSFEAALAGPFLGYKLFLGSSINVLVFSYITKWNMLGKKQRLQWIIKRKLPARIASLLSEKCYTVNPDCVDAAIRFFGIQPHKISISSLGVDVTLFRMPDDEYSQRERSHLRNRFGFRESEIVCIYTGRLTQRKDPVYLAESISILIKQGLPFRGLFVGNGPQEDAIKAYRGNIVHPFVPFRELPPLYWASDIAVWPKQESISQLDVAGCGLPLVLSDRVGDDRRFDGNGLLYKEGDVNDLVSKLRILSEPNLRRRMGEHGARKMREHYSWDHIARQRLKDYEEALGH